MGRWSIDRRLFTGIGTLSLLLLVSGGISIWAGSQMKRQLDVTSHDTARALDLARQIERDAVVLDAEQRRLVLSGLGGDQAGLTHARETIESTRQVSTKHLGELKGHLEADRQEHLDDITTKLNAWETSNARVIQLIAAGDASGALDVTRKTSGPLLESVRATATSMAAQQEQAFAESVEVSEANYGFMRMLLIGMLLLSIPVAAGVGFSVRTITRTLRGVTSELGNGAQQLAAAAGQVAGASQALSHGASQQAASLEETSAAMVEMTSIAKRNAEASHSVADMTAQATALINATNGALGEMVVSMGAIKTSSDKVARIIKTIDEIAFQTNILALNAAVEAARAGAAGMGFAVVADEVRNLAQRSAQAASDTASLIEESIARASEGQHRVEQVSKSMTEVSSSATRIKALVDEVSSSSREQIRGIDQVNIAVLQMEKVTQATASNAEENAAVGEELSAQAEAAMTAVRRLSLLIDADTTDAGHVDRTSSPRSSNKIVPLRRRHVAQATRDDNADIDLEGTGTFGPF